MYHGTGTEFYRRRASRFVGCAVGGLIPALALAACPIVTASTSWAADAQQPHRGGILTVMLERDVKSLDPLFGNSVSIDRKFYNLYAESLLVTDPQGEVHPNLATSWEVQDDGKTIVFHLRHNVTFQDGTPFNAEAAKFNLDRVIDPKWKVPLRPYVAELTSIEVLDDDTIKVHLTKPAAPFLSMMAAEPGEMVSPTAIRTEGEAFVRQPIGTGPFIITSRTNNEVTAKRNEHYWRNGADGKPLPYLDGVHMVINPSEAIRVIQVRSGAAQLSDAVSPRSQAQVEHDPNLVVLNARLGLSHLLNFNVTRPPFDNVDLRRAVTLGINRMVLAKALTQGSGVALEGFEPPGGIVYDPGIHGHPYDPATAKQLLAKMGTHQPVTLTIIQRDYDVQIAQIIQSMLKEIGLDVHVEVIERLSYLQKILTYNYDFGLTQDPLQRPDPDTFYANGYSRTAAINYTGFKDPKIFDLVNQAHAELDWTKRKADYARIQQDVIDAYYQTPLFWNPTNEIASKKLHGIEREGPKIWIYAGMWLNP
jgi:peptide/nickel transport system substrate-binding protein